LFSQDFDAETLILEHGTESSDLFLMFRLAGKKKVIVIFKQ